MSDDKSQVFEIIIKLLRQKTKQSLEPMTREIVLLYGKNPYLILISCLLSLQNRDVVTFPVAKKLFSKAITPQDMVKLSLKDLLQTISSVNYFKTKALRIQEVSQDILQRFAGAVPSTRKDLLSMKGVGIKTANLVLAEAFDIPAICVDTHVHRLSNHWGLVSTKTPAETESALQKIIPQKYWKEWNYLLVKYGQSICKAKTCTNDICSDIYYMLSDPALGVIVSEVGA